MKTETKRMFDKSNELYTSATMLASIDNKAIVECLIKWFGWSCSYTNTFNVFNDNIANVNKYDIVKLSIKVDDTNAIITFDKVTSLTELMNSHCITSQLNEAIAAFILKAIDKSSINYMFNRDNWIFSSFQQVDVEKEVPKSPINLRIPNKEELDTLRSEYFRRKNAVSNIEIPLPNYLQDNANEVILTEDAGNLIIASSVEDATIIED